MKLSVKQEYALRALFDLACHPPGQPVKIAEISRRQGIPQKFLELILASLKQGGFVESRRGPEGGYLLARPASELTVGEVLRFIDGGGRGQRRRRQREDNPFANLWQQVDEAVSRILDNTTFAQIVEHWLERQRRYVPDWQI